MAQNTMGLREANKQTLEVDIYPKGLDGKNGISISAVNINNQNHLICTMSDGTTIDAGKINMENGNFGTSIVQSLPTSNISISTIYCILKDNPTENNKYNKYLYINSNWENVGGSDDSLLDDYYTKDEIDETIEDIEEEISTTKTELQQAIANHTNSETIHTTFADKSEEYYLLGSNSSEAEQYTDIKNTKIKDISNSGVKYISGNEEEKGKLYIDEDEVVTNLFFTIS